MRRFRLICKIAVAMLDRLLCESFGTLQSRQEVISDSTHRAFEMGFNYVTVHFLVHGSARWEFRKAFPLSMAVCRNQGR